MPQSSFFLELVSPDAIIYQGDVRALMAPAAEGYLGVLPRHAPLTAGLKTGTLKIETVEGERIFFALSGGFLEVAQDHSIILADAAERAEKIDLRRAQAAYERAKQTLAQKPDNLSKVEAALMRAINRLQVANKYGGKRRA